MIQVLLADDERIMREGIANNIDWAALGMELVFSAENGRDAIEYLSAHEADLIITDVCMPRVNGLELIEAASDLRPHAEFVILSGYDEFEYASQAMRMGVRHYLLKPCSVEEMTRVLSQVSENIRRLSDERAVQTCNEQELKRLLPQARMSYLRDLCLRQLDFREIEVDDRRLMRLGEGLCRVALVEAESSLDVARVAALKALLQDHMTCPLELLTRISGRALLVLGCEAQQQDELISELHAVQQRWYSFRCERITVALSGVGGYDELSTLYDIASRCMDHRFYLGDGVIITPDLLPSGVPLNGRIAFDMSRVLSAVSSGDTATLSTLLDQFRVRLSDGRLDAAAARGYCLELLIDILRQEDPGRLGEAVVKWAQGGASTLEQMVADIHQLAESAAERHYQAASECYGAIVERMIELTEQMLGREDFSLTLLARDVMFMNEDYLGRLFRKRTDTKFSHYVMNLRIEHAKQLLLANADARVFEVAESVGMGNNPQYFSQLFKRITGQTPQEYRQSASSSTL
ncbi:response regulator [Bacillota bacterium Meth-B3]